MIWLAANLVFAAGHPLVFGGLPAIVQTFIVNAMLFVLPGAGWSWLGGSTSRRLGARLAKILLLSTTALLLLLAGCRVAGVVPTQTIAWTVTWLITNAGFAARSRAAQRSTSRRALTRKELALGCALFFGGYGLYFCGATRVVPPMVDHDLEVQGTGYGLLTRFEPLLLTDRGTLYYVAHPPLLHFYTGASFLYWGRLHELRFFDEASQRAREGGGEARERFGAGLSKIYERYDDRPHLVETRTPSLFLASATVALLGLWIGRVSHRLWMGLLVAAAYATSPEVFVRSSYGGYFAIGGLATLLMLLGAEQWRRARGPRAVVPILAVGAWAALADHKLVLIPAAIVVYVLVASRRPAAVLHPIAWGFAAGTLAFWGFGLFVAPVEFVRDHVFAHGLDRITHTNPLGYGGYPGPLGLWREFIVHTGYVLLPAALVLLVRDVFVSPGGHGVAARPLRGMWLTWVAVSAAAFSLVDWRMTKHLMPLLIGLPLMLAPSRRSARWRVAVPALVAAVVVVWNLTAVASIARDFGGFPVTPDW
jgi:hypothetical protein